MSDDETRTPEPVDAEITAEACGRCSMSTVVGAVANDQSPEERAERDPFADGRIEVDESSLRRVSPAGYLGDLKRRVDEIGRRIGYGE
ncbi:hypothetical protein [Halorubrum tebenquichense]|uniref:Uncharacterized protein n=1 Tax=Halorubrum tebenquichense DSM 14210 TaxID=1227485 RepID=M0DUJ0_9EURY|nr:hypothetical protein [Halorubrum tebenquichense]ELZ38473.1 hypothetical protein C472_07333 [Halorubrum tebenquichense DSM 14210]